MAFKEFKIQLAAYMGREAGAFQRGTVNLLDRAVNMARKHAEREHNFEYSRTAVKVNVSLTLGGTLSTAVDFDDGVTIVPVKRIERAFLSLSDGSGYVPIELGSRMKQQERLKRSYSGMYNLEAFSRMPQVPGYSLQQQANKIYLNPGGSAAYNGVTTVTVALDVIRWQDDYSLDADTDFILEHCEDWLLFRSIFELNFFLKEDERVPVSASALKEAWESVVKWDTQIINASVDDANLE